MIKSSAILGLGEQEMGSLGPIRELLGSVGFQARPMKTASVKREFTFTIPSKAVIWMLVVIGI